jgi:hypothetical protein
MDLLHRPSEACCIPSAELARYPVGSDRCIADHELLLRIPVYLDHSGREGVVVKRDEAPLPLKRIGHFDVQGAHDSPAFAFYELLPRFQDC